MGDQRLELKIQEEEEDEFSKSEESKMSMILSKGWSLGKKIVMTGMAISSAPIVLPPLVIFSSIGFAVAVPFGIVFVSYACTHKLMSKLLSRPLNPPPLLEYKIYDDDDYVEEEDFQEDGFRGEFMEEEEKKFREDIKENMEMRIELIGDEKEEEEEKPVGMMEEESKETLYLDNFVEEEEKPGEDMNGVMEEERADGTYVYNDVEAEEKPDEDMDRVMEEERADGMYFDNYVVEEEKPGEDLNGVMEEERTDGMYFDNYVVEEEKPGEDMNGVMEERADGTYFDIDVEAEEKPLEKYVGDTEEENLRRGTGGAMEDYREVDETIEEEEKPVEVIMDEIEEELVMREKEEVKDEENADIVIEFEEGGVKENVGSIEEEIKSVREMEGVVKESRPEENVGLAVVEEEKPVLGMEGEKGEASEETAMPTVSSALPLRKGGRRKKGKKHVKKTAENMGEKERLVREAKGGIKDTRDEEPLDKLIATDIVEEQNAEEIGREQNVSGMAQEKYIVGKELPSPQVEIIGVIEDGNVSFVTQKDGNVEEAVPVLDTPQEGAIVEEVVPVVDVMWEDNMEEAPVVDVTQVGYIEEAVPVAEINEVVEEESVNDVTEKNYIAQQVVPIVELNGVTPMAEMNGVSKEEDRDDASVGKIANDVDQVRPIKGAKEVMEKNKGVVFEKNTDNEEIPVEEVHGIVKVHEGVSLEQVSAVKEPTAQNLPMEKTDSAEHPLSAEMAESKFNKEAHEQKGIIPSKEVLYTEEKIWEQINAMRKIVGYKAALQTTCIDELKALYIFIGVEPPVAFRVPSDLAEINDKLHLLMSIIGVK